MSFTNSPFSVIVKKPKVYANNTNLYAIVMDEMKKHGTGCSLNHIDVSDVTSMNHLFYRRRFDGKCPDISEWNTCNVKHMDMMFSHSDFNGDILCWDTKNLETMSNMFECNRWFECNISGWDTGKVYDMRFLFYESNFNHDISKWNVRKVKYMQCMFCGNYYFNNDISDWELESVEDMSGMFANSKFNKDVGKWVKFMKKETKVNEMFSGNTDYSYDRSVFRNAAYKTNIA